VFGSEVDESVDEEGHKTDSTAKKHPATAALNPVTTYNKVLLTNQSRVPYARENNISKYQMNKPEEMPAAEPAARSEKPV
jgi:hypothetical protein